VNDIQELNPVSETIRADLSAKNEARDKTISQSREVIRHCAECIRAIHRREWENVDKKLALIDGLALEMSSRITNYPDLYFSGYTQDALKEVVEAHITAAIIRGLPLPTPAQLHVESSTYLNGMCEAATELRRFILDIMRLHEQHSDEAERLLAWMDAIYDQMVTFDFPDALTGGLRRQTDVLRGVLERTRGDMTLSLRQQRLQQALARFESGVLPVAPESPEETRRVLLEFNQQLQTLKATPEQEPKLEELRREIADALKTGSAPASLRERLEASLLHFEADHPDLTVSIQAVINALSNAGV
jgi:translin